MPSWNVVVAGMLYCLAAFKLTSISGGSIGPRSVLPTPCDPRLNTWFATHVDLSEAVRGLTGLPAGNSWELLAPFLGLNYKIITSLYNIIQKQNKLCIVKLKIYISLFWSMVRYKNVQIVTMYDANILCEIIVFNNWFSGHRLMHWPLTLLSCGPAVLFWQLNLLFLLQPPIHTSNLFLKYKNFERMVFTACIRWNVQWSTSSAFQVDSLII